MVALKHLFLKILGQENDDENEEDAYFPRLLPVSLSL